MKTNTLNLAQFIKNDSKVFIHGGAATPKVLISHLLKLKGEVSNVTLYHLHTHGPADYAKPEYKGTFNVHNLFVGSNLRPYMDMDRVDYLPCFLSEIGLLFRRNIVNLDVALVHVSPPDQHGYCSLGTSVDVAKAAFETARYKIAQINPRMPRTHGDGQVHISDINAFIEVDEPLALSHPEEPTEAEMQIGRNIAAIIEDGSTLQTGIGCVPSSVLMALGQHKNLGIHTEMWTDPLLPLIEKGVVTNSLKKVHPGKTLSSFVVGSEKVFSFLNDNPSCIMLEATYVNQPNVIARNPKVVAINSCVEIDLTGQVCADSVGTRIISGVGGQMDFMRAAFLSEGGKPVMAFSSKSKKGVSRIVPTIKQGGGVVTTRAHIHYVATEYGVTNLAGLSLKQRAKELIRLAHPEDRESLEKAWFDIHKNSVS
jgi:4-hydroxybutyrate CoA-transferase